MKVRYNLLLPTKKTSMSEIHMKVFRHFAPFIASRFLLARVFGELASLS